MWRDYRSQVRKGSEPQAGVSLSRGWWGVAEAFKARAVWLGTASAGRSFCQLPTWGGVRWDIVPVSDTEDWEEHRPTGRLLPWAWVGWSREEWVGGRHMGSKGRVTLICWLRDA